MDILTEAAHLVEGDRNLSYGNPLHTGKYDIIAKLWSAIFNTPVTPKQVILAMLTLKVGRELVKHQRDNLVDIAGYARILELVEGEDT